MRFTLLFLVSGLGIAGTPNVATVVKAIGQKCQAAREYSFEGELTLAGQRGTDSGKVLSHAKIRLAFAPGGKFFLRIEPEGKEAYVLVSNGQKSWAWVPRLKQYTEDEAAILEDERGAEASASDSERDLAETFAREVMPVLGRLHENVQAADFSGEVPVRFNNRKERWPLLRVMSRPDSDNSQSLTQLGVDPETLAIGHMVYSTILRADYVKIQLTLDFSAFEIGPLPDTTFTFEPPKGAKLVDTVPIPGQTGSLLLNQSAPDFELKTLDGEKVRLADLRGRPVLLSFWASWCGPCRRELPQLSALLQDYKDKGLVVLGINDEGKGPARKYAEQAGLSFPTLDDSGSKAHRLYRVHSIPTVFLIDKSGKIVLFLKGAKEPVKLRAALTSVGL